MVAFINITLSNLILYFKFGLKQTLNGPARQFMYLKITKNCKANHFCPWIFIFVPKIAVQASSKTNQNSFNPILGGGGGGHYGPDDREPPGCFRRVRATTTKIHDFVSVYV